MTEIAVKQRLRNGFLSIGSILCSERPPAPAVLMYHGINDARHGTSASFLEWQLNRMESDSRFLEPGDLLHDEVDNGILLTFDDGHPGHLEEAVSRLNNHDATGLFFVTADYMEGDNNYLDEGDIRDISEAGHVIGSHGVSHEKLTELSRPDVKRELRESKRIIEDAVGEEVTHFSYPHGRYNEDVTSLVKETGYRAGYVIGDQFLSAAGNRMTIPRIWIHNGLNRSAFRGKLTTALSWLNTLRRVD